jgi:putative membrane protein
MYLVLKSLHIIFIVTWFAGLFYIFRLFVYHRMHFRSDDITNLFSVMEKRLLYYICLPSSVLVFFFGSMMIYNNQQLLFEFWLILKLIFVAFIFLYQWFSFYTYRQFKNNNFFLTEKKCRYINEIPSILLILIIFLAVLKIHI